MLIENHSVLYGELVQSGNTANSTVLQMYVKFYQDGIMQVNFLSQGEPYRFSISKTGIGVEWANLKQIMNLSPYYVAGNTYQFLSADKKDLIKYVFQMKPFRIF